MKEAIGSILSCGWTLNDVLDLTFEQIELSAEMIGMSKAATLNAIVTPLLETIGGPDAKVRNAEYVVSKRKQKSMTDEEAKAKDQKLLRSIRSAGIPFRVKQS